MLIAEEKQVSKSAKVQAHFTRDKNIFFIKYKIIKLNKTTQQPDSLAHTHLNTQFKEIKNFLKTIKIIVV